MKSVWIPLQNACDRSQDVEFVSRIEYRDGRWFVCNRAGIVEANGATCHDMCVDLLGDFKVNP